MYSRPWAETSSWRTRPSRRTASIASSSGKPAGIPADWVRPDGVTTTTCTPGGASTGASTLAVVVAQRLGGGLVGGPLVDREQQHPDDHEHADDEQAGLHPEPHRRTTEVGHGRPIR